MQYYNLPRIKYMSTQQRRRKFITYIGTVQTVDEKKNDNRKSVIKIYNNIMYQNSKLQCIKR